MILRKKRWGSCRLYLILDAQVCSYDKLFEVLKSASLSGVDIVQLRDKLGTARDILRFTERALAWLKGRVPFIVNDRVDLALLSGASGVHLGQEDISVPEARRVLGHRRIIGVSCQTLGHVRRAGREGADYIGFGSVFKTLTKPERSPMDLKLLRRVRKEARVPVFAIGGITRDNLPLVRASGIGRIAVCRDILLADDVALSVGYLKTMLTAA